MRQLTVASLARDMKFEGFLLVRSAEQRTSSNGGKYLDMTLCDTTGDINCKMWDGTVQPPKQGSVVKVRGTVQEYNGRLQMRIERLRDPAPEDDVDPAQLMPCAPEKPESMLAEIHRTIDRMQTPELQKILREMIRLCGDQLNYYPAAQRVHHAERSGLLHHTLSVLRAAEALLPLYPYLDGDLLRAGCIAHDLSKTAEFLSDESGNVADYSAEGQLLGHLVHGVVRVQEAAKNCGVTGEYVLLLSHMVISHHGQPDHGSPRPPMFPEAEMLHLLDDMDAKMNEMEGVMRRTPAGAFSEKIWSLDRRLYHPRTPAAEPETKAGNGPSAPDGRSTYDGLL
ncbi:MAG: HD domain-containing protein [Clostridiales bacterium]|nr:HD domain-containing protein [Clostridiales bacterium]